MRPQELCPVSWFLPDWLHVVLGLLTLTLGLAAWQLFFGPTTEAEGEHGEARWRIRIGNLNPVLLIILGLIGLVALTTLFYEPRRQIIAIWEGIDPSDVTYPASMDYVTETPLSELHAAMPSQMQQSVNIIGRASEVKVKGKRIGACYADLMSQLCADYAAALQCSRGAGRAALIVCEAGVDSCPP